MSSSTVLTSSAVKPFTTFHIWPDLVQIKLLESLSWNDCLRLRLVSKNWCAGICYASHVWSLKKPSVRLNQEYFITKMHDQLRYDSISTLIVKDFTLELNTWANLLNAQFLIPQFDKIIFKDGNSSDNIMKLLTNYCKFAKSLLLHGCCFKEIKPDLLCADMNLQSVQELEIGGCLYCDSESNLAWNGIMNHISCLATLLTTNKFKFLRKLSLGCRVLGGTMPERGKTYDQFTATMDIFLKTHGAKIKELSINLYSNSTIIGIYDSLKYLKNVETLSLEFTGDSVPIALVDQWKIAISSFKRLTNVTADYDHAPTNTFEILLGKMLYCSDISSSLIVTNWVDDLNWLYSYPRAHLKHLKLEVFDNRLGDFEKSLYNLDSLSYLKIKFKAGNEENGIWRNVLVKWITKIAPNVKNLVVKLNSFSRNSIGNQKCNSTSQRYYLKLDHVSDLIHGLKMLTKLDVFCKIEGIPDSTAATAFCNGTDRHCVYWTEFKIVKRELKKDIYYYERGYVDSGFRFRIVN